MICRQGVNEERQRQKAIVLAYTEIFFACDRLKKRLVPRQAYLRCSEEEEISWDDIYYFGTLTRQKYQWI